MDSTQRDLKVVKFEQNQFTQDIQKMNFISSPLGELASSPSAIVFIGTKCCSLRCCIPIGCCCNGCTCGEYYRYNTLTNVNGVQKFLFKNIAKLNCSLCSTDKISRFDSCKSMALSSYDQYNSDDGGAVFSEMVKNPGCFCFGCCTQDFNVNIPNENKLAGIVRMKGFCSLLCSECCKSKGCCKDCCQDVYYCCDILTANSQQMYTIYLVRCCIACVPNDWCSHFTFYIRDQNHNDVGRIDAERNCCNFCGMCGINYTYNIAFPTDATPELKLTIINAVISIDLFRM